MRRLVIYSVLALKILATYVFLREFERNIAAKEAATERQNANAKIDEDFYDLEKLQRDFGF